MVRALLVTVLIAACGGEGTPATGGTPSVATAEAGSVRELSGKVTAMRGAESRVLAVGGPVSADDVIDTGGDGSVVIELAHNHALWSLESGIKARVDQSVAWGLPKQDAAKPIEHATSSAGRHADREAANTAVSADEGAKEAKQERELDRAKDPAPAVATPTEKPATTAPPPPRPEPKGSPKRAGGGGGGGGGCDEVSCMLDGGSACCAKFKKTGRTGPSTPSPTDATNLPQLLSRPDIELAMTEAEPRIIACGKAVGASGMLKLSVTVGGDGRVTKVEVKETPDPAINRCVVAAMKKQSFPKSQRGAGFTYPYVF